MLIYKVLATSRPIKRNFFLQLFNKILQLTKPFLFFNLIQKRFCIFRPLNRNIQTTNKPIKMLNQIIYDHFFFIGLITL